MLDENSKIISILEIQRRQMREKKHSCLVDSALADIEEAACNCELLFGRSADEIAGLTATVLENMYDVEHPKNAQYFHVLSDKDNENLATFVTALAGDVISANDPTYDRGGKWGQRMQNARRVVSES